MKKQILHLAIVCLSVIAVAAQDPLKVAPEAYKLEFENDYVKVQRVNYAPRVKIPEHDHTSFGAAYVYLNDAGPVVFRHIGLSYGAVTRPAIFFASSSRPKRTKTLTRCAANISAKMFRRARIFRSPNLKTGRSAS